AAASFRVIPLAPGSALFPYTTLFRSMLFIRETTNINHHTFQFACRAEAEGLAVMDDPQSIIRCTNKVYLADLFSTRGIPTPKTRSEEHTSELQSRENLVCRLLLEKKN